MNFNKNDARSLRDSLLTIASNQWQMPKEDILENMDKIAFVESKNVIDAIQESGGPGRGMFQYEIGKGQGAHTAINRLINIFDHTPTFLEGLTSKDYDISGLSKDAQETLFLADKLKDLTASFKGIDTDEKVKLAREWADEHYAGPETKKSDKIKFFLKELGFFK